MSIPYSQSCPACGAPPERVTKKHWCWMHPAVSGERIDFLCDVCGKRWAEEVNSVGRIQGIPNGESFLTPDAQEVLRLQNTVTKLRKGRDYLHAALGRANKFSSGMQKELRSRIDVLKKENRRLRDGCEFSFDGTSKLLSDEDVKSLQKALSSDETSASVLVNDLVQAWTHIAIEYQKLRDDVAKLPRYDVTEIQGNMVAIEPNDRGMFIYYSDLKDVLCGEPPGSKAFFGPVYVMQEEKIDARADGI